MLFLPVVYYPLLSSPMRPLEFLLLHCQGQEQVHPWHHSNKVWTKNTKEMRTSVTLYIAVSRKIVEKKRQGVHDNPERYCG